MKVFSGEYTRASHVKNSALFKRLYPEDGVFISSFEFHKMPSRQAAKKIRFLLAEIESHAGHASDYMKTTLEHICPYHPDEHWFESFGEGTNDIQDRLGNMVLLDKDDLRRSDFETKKKIYKNSVFSLAKKVAEYSEWNLQTLNDYQAWLAQHASQTWNIGYPSYSIKSS
jgi:hypothetical protein